MATGHPPADLHASHQTPTTPPTGYGRSQFTSSGWGEAPLAQLKRVTAHQEMSRGQRTPTAARCRSICTTPSYEWGNNDESRNRVERSLSVAARGPRRTSSRRQDWRGQGHTIFEIGGTGYPFWSGWGSPPPRPICDRQGGSPAAVPEVLRCGALAGARSRDQGPVPDRLRKHCLLEQSVEQQSSASRAPAVETERELFRWASRCSVLT